jgi:hemoglobin-like flavoprotein
MAEALSDRTIDIVKATVPALEKADTEDIGDPEVL